MGGLPIASHRCALGVGAAVLAATLILAALAGPGRAQGSPGVGAGIFPVHGTAGAAIELDASGTYYLCVSPDAPSEFVDARLVFNGSLAADLNRSEPGAALVSLVAGNYSLHLAGQGRAALGWDFTDGSVQDFPDSATVTAFLRPNTPRVDLVVSMGNAQEVHIEVYGDDLLLASATNVTASGTLNVTLPSSHATFAVLVASMVLGNPQGVFGLAWSSPTPTPVGPDLGSQILVAALWVVVPVVLALLAFLVLRRRSGSR